MRVFIIVHAHNHQEIMKTDTAGYGNDDADFQASDQNGNGNEYLHAHRPDEYNRWESE